MAKADINLEDDRKIYDLTYVRGFNYYWNQDYALAYKAFRKIYLYRQKNPHHPWLSTFHETNYRNTLHYMALMYEKKLFKNLNPQRAVKKAGDLFSYLYILQDQRGEEGLKRLLNKAL